MNGDTKQAFADGEYYFRLGLSELQELQALTNKGPERIMRDLRGPDWKIADIFETIRIGLVGALDKNEKLSSPEMARTLVELYVIKRRGLVYYKKLALVILAYALMGDPTDQDKTKKKKTVTAKKTPSGGGISNKSTQSAPRTDSAPSKSAK